MQKETSKRKKRRKQIGLYQSKSKRRKPNVPVVVHEVVNITAPKRVHSSNIPASARSIRLQKRNERKFQLNYTVEENEQNNLQDPSSPQQQTNNSDNEDTDYYSDGQPSNMPSSFLQTCLRMNTDQLVQNVMRQFSNQGMLRHFIAFLECLSDGRVQANNISIQLAMEYCLLQSLTNSTKMRYHQSTTQFWEAVLAVGGPRLLRFFSSDKHFGQVNSGLTQKGKYVPTSGSYNFAVPDERVLRKSSTNIPNKVKCGIIEESFTFFSSDKQYVLSLDGKQTGQGLKDEDEGDVDLWGFEGPPCLKDTIIRLHDEIDLIENVEFRVSEDTSVLSPVIRNLRRILQCTSKRIRALREAKVRHEILRYSFNRRIAKFPGQSSKYVLAFSEIDAFICRADGVIAELLSVNAEWCKIMSMINQNDHDFHKEGPIRLDDQRNSLTLLDNNYIELHHPGMLDRYPQFIKQRSQRWFDLRKQCRITGSTMHNALGLRTLKAQKEHYDEFVLSRDVPHVVNAAMLHGQNHEVIIHIFYT